MMPRRWAGLAAFVVLLGLGASCARPTAAQNLCPPRTSTNVAASGLAALRASAEDRGSVRVIISLSVPQGALPAVGDLRGAALATLTQAGVEGASALGERLPLVVAEVTAAELDALYPNPQFAAWSEDRIAMPTLAESGPLVQVSQLWDLGGRGAGQAVAILDTGVDAAHPFLNGRVSAEACFSTTSLVNNSTSTCPNGQASQTGAGAGRPCTAQGCVHGTHVAGIAAGRGTDFSGMAPDAEIIAVQVFSTFRGAACGGGSATCIASFTSDQIRGLDFVLQQANARAVASVNMSLGGGHSTTACDSDMTKSVIDQLRAAGVAVAIASGNDGFRDGVSFPGCISTAVTVGATSKQDELADFSNCGPQVDLHAPGVGIRSSVPGGGFAAFSGTSMATPHVAGAFAALRSVRPSATVDQIEAALSSSGLDVGGRPRIRLLDAANALMQTAPVAEAAMAEPNDVVQRAVALIADLPADQPARFIVGVNAPAGSQGPALAAAIANADAAARQAGATYVGRMGNQPMLAIEATPTQVRALAASGAITTIQLDSVARTQN